jgi:hypothetical protein
MWRAGFGPAVEQLGDLSKFSPKQFYKALVSASDKKPEYINVADEYLQDLYNDNGDRQKKKELDKDERKMIQQKSRESIRNLNLYWMHEMVNSGAQLREKMAFLLAWTFCLSQPEYIFSARPAGCFKKKCAGQFQNIAERSFQNSSHAQLFK